MKTRLGMVASSLVLLFASGPARARKTDANPTDANPTDASASEATLGDTGCQRSDLYRLQPVLLWLL
jgi:hypothetical protein